MSKSIPTGRALTPRNGNDNIATPQPLADTIVRHFRPHGEILEPCCGVETQPFVEALRALPGYMQSVFPTWGDLRAESPFNFLEHDGHYDWVVTNPPWSKLLSFLTRSMRVADNVVFLALLTNWLQKAKRDAITRAGFGIVEILHLDEPDEPAWPRTGFALGATWIRRGWTGPIHNNLTMLGKRA